MLLLLLACADKASDDTADPQDSDTSAESGQETAQADFDQDGTPDDADCDFDNAAVHPGASEVCNGVDDDCDGLVDLADDGLTDGTYYYVDADGDGHGGSTQALACEQKANHTLKATDCDDTDAAVHPGGTEACNGHDDDCDTLVDDADPDMRSLPLWYLDDDGDTYGTRDDTIAACEQPEGYVPEGGDCDDRDPAVNPDGTETCNGDDDDCDELVDGDDDSLVDPNVLYQDLDGDSFGTTAATSLGCHPGAGWADNTDDCDDTNEDVNPNARETCTTGDEDCDGLEGDDDPDRTGGSRFYADADADGYGAPGAAYTQCAIEAGLAANAEDCDDTNAAVHPAATETCDGVDNDCDDDVDGEDAGLVGDYTLYRDSDGDGYGNASAAIAECAILAGYTEDSTDCNDNSAVVNPGEDEVCDDRDNDCDGLTDGADDSATGVGAWYRDADRDGQGDRESGSTACSRPSGYTSDDQDCDDTNPDVYVGADELCDGLDGDCDGGVDEDPVDATAWYADADLDGLGDPSTEVLACEGPTDYVDNGEDCDDTDAAVLACEPDDGSVCAAELGTDQGTVPAYDGTCDESAGFLSYGGHCYYAVTTVSTTWGDARATCIAAGGYLAVPTSVEEMDATVQVLAPTAHLGGCDVDVEGTWRWITGEDWDYAPWGSGEPSGTGDSDCVRAIAGGSFNDVVCSNARDFVCEFE